MDREPPSNQKSRREVIKIGAGLAMTAAGSELVQAGHAFGQILNEPMTPEQLFSGIDTVVVLVMENRSFDHYFGAANADPAYPGAGLVDGLTGDEYNIDSKGRRISPYPLASGIQSDPPHEWSSCHAQWNGGANDGFILSHQGSFEHEVMGYFDRRTLPFSYWLADNFTLCDHWFSGLLGPTWPNRAIIHATNAAGLKSNRPYLNPPPTIWDKLPLVGKNGFNYHAGLVGTYTGMYLKKVLQGVNPMKPIDRFFADAKAGTLPSFSLIDPDFQTNDDHPSHDVALGQALIASVYKALAASPQWSRSLLIVTYDEHGGFYDHVPPPQCVDANPDYRQLGIRVPSLVIGPTVKRGAVCSTVLEHSSIAATLRSVFGMGSLSPRMDAAADVSSCIDPDRIGNPGEAPTAPAIRLHRETVRASLQRAAIEGQTELSAMVETGAIPPQYVDQRSREERTLSWLKNAEELGAIEFY